MSNALAPRILIAGASGYIGRALIPRLLEKFPEARITALSRAARPSDDPRVEWVACDLFSLKAVEAAVPPTLDLGVYLVHSMAPTAYVDQGSFADYDVIMADNFARALKPRHVRQVMYLGGLTPSAAHLSLHLQSRREVEETFARFGLPATVFRAGLVLGEGGSSFQILLKLVKRLPVMICPKWTHTLTTPVSLAQVTDALTRAALEPEHVGKTYDLAGCRSLSYLEMMRQTARRIGRHRYFVKFPFFTPTLSRLWVTLVTNTPRALVYPLVESLEHEMIARPDHRFPGLAGEGTYDELLHSVSTALRPRRAIFTRRPPGDSVRSVQRLPLPPGRDAVWVKDRYLAWLPRAMRPLLRVIVEGDDVTFAILSRRLVLLRLRFSPERSSPDRQLFYIRKSPLSRGSESGRLEFRTVLDGRYVIAAIHDFKPALPWLVYKYTQALAHLIVMSAFRRHLARA